MHFLHTARGRSGASPHTASKRAAIPRGYIRRHPCRRSWSMSSICSRTISTLRLGSSRNTGGSELRQARFRRRAGKGARSLHCRSSAATLRRRRQVARLGGWRPSRRTSPWRRRAWPGPEPCGKALRAPAGRAAASRASAKRSQIEEWGQRQVQAPTDRGDRLGSRQSSPINRVDRRQRNVGLGGEPGDPSSAAGWRPHGFGEPASVWTRRRAGEVGVRLADPGSCVTPGRSVRGHGSVLI